MDCVNILKTIELTEIKKNIIFDIIFVCISIIMYLTIFIAAPISIFISSIIMLKASLITFLIMLIVLLTMAVYEALFPKMITNGKYQYEVTISDNVKFNEFMNKYKILNIKDGVYLVEEIQR